MSPAPPCWGGRSRFYLPNEDAAVVCKAVARLDTPVRRPVFVGGSGMVLLEGAGALAELERATFVDIAPFQSEYFRMVVQAVEQASGTESLRNWFLESVYPLLRDHYRARGQHYKPEDVMAALCGNFGLRFFFEDDVFLRVRRALARIEIVQDDIVSYLAPPGPSHDFIYLSNVPDYLPEGALQTLFAACRARHAPVYLLLTSACPNQEAVQRVWESAGYRAHPATGGLNGINRGLGASTVHKKWNRPGSIWLLRPENGSAGGNRDGRNE